MTIASMELGSFRGERRTKKGMEITNIPRTVMREGPVVLDNEKGESRNQWALFQEYFKKSEFLIVGEFYGERMAGIVDPQIHSRNGSTKDNPTGEYWNPRGEFRETALMAANLSLLERGKLTEEEVLKQYRGLTQNGGGIDSLYGMLGRSLGRIKYQELERKDAIGKRDKKWQETRVTLETKPNDSEVSAGHVFMVGSAEQMSHQFVVKEEARAMSKGKKIKVACAVGILSVLVSSCVPTGVDINIVTPEVPIVETTRTTTFPTETATQAPTEAPTQTATTRPTETEAPDPYEVDVEKFQSMPSSYEYLLAHPDEFVQAPDPLTNRVEFDKWWNEKLVPAVGYEVWGREVTLKTDGLYETDNLINTGTNDIDGNQLLSSPQSFYFESEGTIYPVLLFNVQILERTPGKPNITLALILCDGPGRIGTDALEGISSGKGIHTLSIVTRRLGEADVVINKFVDAGFSPTLDTNNPNAPPVFGPGIIKLSP